MTGRLLAIVLSLAVALVTAVPVAAAPASNPVVAPSDAVARTGLSYSQWSARWWQYAVSYPTPANPLLSSTGSGCAGKQLLPTFFLVGSFVGSVTRTQCRVPSSAYLFFPLINIIDVNTASQTPAELFAEIAAQESGAHDLHASIDGVAVSGLSSYRTLSSADGFTITVPGNNLFGLAAGSYSPAVADGYYLLLAPLGPGTHTVSFGGTDGTDFTQDVTYILTTVP
jgi:hypothetical protein